jgi:hypothetical protein
MAMRTAGAYLVAVADGAGGTGSGAAAAERLTAFLAKLTVGSGTSLNVAAAFTAAGQFATRSSPETVRRIKVIPARLPGYTGLERALNRIAR